MNNYEFYLKYYYVLFTMTILKTVQVGIKIKFS